MLAYHNDPLLKQSVLANMASHREADNLIQGYGYWKDGKGCAVGCLIKSGNHSEYETRFGIPKYLAWLEDSIFERLPFDDAKKWPERFLDAVQTGADLSMVFYKFIYWMLIDPQDGVLQYANKKRTKDSIKKVASLYKQYIDGEVSLEQFHDTAAAAAAAASAAASASAATTAAADTAAADTSYTAASASAASASTAAAASAASAAAATTAAWKDKKQQATIKQADKLIELIKET